MRTIAQNGIGEFTAGQAAQKFAAIGEELAFSFTAGQAAQKTASATASATARFTAGQAAQKWPRKSNT